MTAHVPPELQEKRRAGLARIDRLAWWLDDAFELPVIRKRVGLDGVLGLVPFAGDLVGAGLSSLIMVEAVRLGAPKRIWLRMGANIGIDFVVGLVPVLGDVFDFVWKNNRRNQKVMRRWLEQVTESEPKRPKWPGTLGVTLGLAGALLVTVALWQVVFGQ